VFLAEKRFEGCGGQTVDDDVRLAIAGQAGLVALGFPDEHFDRLKSILVYPGDWVGKKATALEGGVHLEWRERRLGEAWDGGSVVLAWPAVRRGGLLQDGPRSVVIHEFAHVLDAAEAWGDDSAALGDLARHKHWSDGMFNQYERFCMELEAHGDWNAPLDPYAATSISEFFAVGSEAFFVDPLTLRHRMPAMYALLRELYRQDPAAHAPEP
jgi:Mlc titration factor MtfA (ptsG expression regulator)